MALQILIFKKKLHYGNFNTLQTSPLQFCYCDFHDHVEFHLQAPTAADAYVHFDLVEMICITFLSPFWWSYFVGKGYNSFYEVHFWPRETSTMVVFASVREKKNLFALENIYFFLVWGGGGGDENFLLIQPLVIKDTYSLLIRGP